MADLEHGRRDEGSGLTAVNSPFASRIAYRTDDYSSYRHRLVEALSAAFPEWNPELALNDGRQDMGVALAELFAYLGDQLGFYQDRRANEAFLRTAELRESVIELCRLIDYRILPGASAETLQAFLVKDEEEGGRLPAGFAVKSEAKDGEPALTFETAKEIRAALLRNRLRIAGWNRSTRLLNPSGAPPVGSVLLDQGYGGLEAGSVAVFELTPSPAGGSLYEPVRLTAVTEESLEVPGGDEPLETRRLHFQSSALPADADWPIADLTIHGAPEQEMVLKARERADEITVGTNSFRVTDSSPFSVGRPVLVASEGLLFPARLDSQDAVTDQLTLNRSFNLSLRRSSTRVFRGSYVGRTTQTIRRGAVVIRRQQVSGSPSPGDQLLLLDASGAGLVAVSRIDGAFIYLNEPTIRAFRPAATSFNPTVAVYLYRVTLPSEDGGGVPSTFRRVRARQIGDLNNVYSGATTTLKLDAAYEGLDPGALVVVSDGKQRSVHSVLEVEVVEESSHLTLEGTVPATMEIATTILYGPFTERMRIEGHDRSEESTVPGATGLTLSGAEAELKPGDYLAIEGGGHSEGMRITAVSLRRGETEISLEQELVHPYPLATSVIYGNVVAVDHGETVVEAVLGSGDQGVPNQEFSLQRKPVTHVHDAEGWRGISSTLEVFVEDERWSAVESLAESGPEDRVYQVEIDDQEAVTVRFGDGRHGARLITGRDNVKARYRVGLGVAGNVAAGELATMPQALPFLDSTVNPIAASGGQDRESLELVRRLAPMTVRTLDRAVSLSDYADLALTYAGVAKARAAWVREDGQRLIRVTVAAEEGAPLSLPLKEELLAYLEARRSPHHRVRIEDYVPLPIRLELGIQVFPEFLQSETRLRVEEALSSGLTEEGEKGYFHFDRRQLGDDLALSQVYARVEAVRGVDHAFVRTFRPEGAATAEPLDRIRVDDGALATGGHATDAAVGLLIVQARGGIV